MCKYDDEYWQVWDLYIAALGAYETIKKRFFINEVFTRVRYNYISWEADYINYELIIYLKENESINKQN